MSEIRMGLFDVLISYDLYRPDWVYGLVAMLDKIYENPAYQEDHSDPLLTLTRLEETVEVIKRKEDGPSRGCAKELYRALLLAGGVH